MAFYHPGRGKESRLLRHSDYIISLSLLLMLEKMLLIIIIHLLAKYGDN